MVLVDDALAHLRGEERDAGVVDEFAQHLGAGLAVRAGADHQQRTPGLADRVGRMSDDLLVGDRAAVVAGRDHHRVGVVAGDVLGQFQVRRAGAFLLGATEALAHAGRDVVGRDDLPRVLGQRLHHVDHVDNLEMSLFGQFHRLLAGDHQHRHAAEVGVCGGSHEIRRAGAERGQADAGAAGQAAVGRRHEAGDLFMPREDQLDRGSAQRFEQVEVFFPGNAEHVFHAFGFERFHEQVRRFHDALLRCVRRFCAPLPVRSIEPGG
jgi:hypothetical protein